MKRKAGISRRFTSWSIYILLASLPVCASDPPARAATIRSIVDKFDNISWLPTAPDKPARVVLGGANGVLHVLEERHGALEEIWLSRYLEGAVNGLFVGDVNADGRPVIVVFTDRGRIHYFDAINYTLLWSNPPGEYERITAQAVCNIDDDPQLELLFVANGRLIIYDGRDRFEKWRSDQDNLTTTAILVADIDGDGQFQVVLNDGYVFDARFRNLKWQYGEPFGDRLGVLDIDNNGIMELIGEFRGRFIRVFDLNLRREKSLKPNY